MKKRNKKFYKNNKNSYIVHKIKKNYSKIKVIEILII